MKTKLTVITDAKGGVVGTHVGHGAHSDPITGITAKLVAGPGQHLREIEIEMPTQLRSQQDIEAFHNHVKTHLARIKA